MGVLSGEDASGSLTRRPVDNSHQRCSADARFRQRKRPALVGAGRFAVRSLNEEMDSCVDPNCFFMRTTVSRGFPLPAAETDKRSDGGTPPPILEDGVEWMSRLTCHAHLSAEGNRQRR